MKKVLFIAMMFTFVFVNGQEKKQRSGITVGFNSLTVKLSDSRDSDSATGNGFFIGFFTEFMTSESLSIQPEIHFASSSDEGDSVDQILLPMMLKYYASEQFTIQGGMLFDFLLEDVGDGFNKLGVGLAFGSSYDFTDNLFATARYSLGLNNRLDSSDYKLKYNTFQIGLGYSF